MWRIITLKTIRGEVVPHGIRDLDNGLFEVYRGFQKRPHQQGRFAKNACESSGYYPVGLVKSYSLKALPTTDVFVQDNS